MMTAIGHIIAIKLNFGLQLNKFNSNIQIRVANRTPV